MPNQTEPATLTLIDFLLTRIAEDEAHVHLGPGCTCSVHEVTCGPRVLAECEAKRQIVEDFVYYDKDYRAGFPEFTHGKRDGCLQAVAHLALPYADHPDYRQEWAL